MTHIHVNRNYGGRITDERRILPGVYHLDDPRLFGAGRYLLENGHAVLIADPSAVVAPPPPPPVEEESIGFAVVETEARIDDQRSEGETSADEPVVSEELDVIDDHVDEPEAPKSKRSK